jgi:hypothetical protein
MVVRNTRRFRYGDRSGHESSLSKFRETEWTEGKCVKSPQEKMMIQPRAESTSIAIECDERLRDSDTPPRGDSLRVEVMQTTCIQSIDIEKLASKMSVKTVHVIDMSSPGKHVQHQSSSQTSGKVHIFDISSPGKHIQHEPKSQTGGERDWKVTGPR